MNAQELPVYHSFRKSVKVKLGSLRVRTKASLSCHWRVIISAVQAISSKSLVIVTLQCRASSFHF